MYYSIYIPVYTLNGTDMEVCNIPSGYWTKFSKRIRFYRDVKLGYEGNNHHSFRASN